MEPHPLVTFCKQSFDTLTIEEAKGKAYLDSLGHMTQVGRSDLDLPALFSEGYIQIASAHDILASLIGDLLGTKTATNPDPEQFLKALVDCAKMRHSSYVVPTRRPSVDCSFPPYNFIVTKRISNRSKWLAKFALMACKQWWH